ncbi:uncharacterized protein JCM6883_001038 [Sporobolomyces salmoneus]|uniref:uncharacterized protein n=1 Tax=Sporobolomyces salmoneus TaxID=183962 RepID=UPI00317D6D12
MLVSETSASTSEPAKVDYLETFQYHTVRLREMIVYGRDPCEGIGEIQNALDLARKSEGILASQPGWIVFWVLLLASGLWRIQEMDQVAERLEQVKLILENYEEEIGSEAVEIFREKAATLSRFPGVPFVEGLSVDEPKIQWRSDLVAATESDTDLEDKEMEVEEAQAEESRSKLEADQAPKVEKDYEPSREIEDVLKDLHLV